MCVVSSLQWQALHELSSVKNKGGSMPKCKRRTTCACGLQAASDKCNHDRTPMYYTGRRCSPDRRRRSRCACNAEAPEFGLAPLQRPDQAPPAPLDLCQYLPEICWPSAQSPPPSDSLHMCNTTLLLLFPPDSLRCQASCSQWQVSSASGYVLMPASSVLAFCLMTSSR